MSEVIAIAPAKINLTLDIVGTREDGYHLLESIFQSVTLADTIHVRKKLGKKIKLVAPRCTCPVEKNTAYRAAMAFFNYTGLSKGVRIELSKEIPQQAGMGGGSADAAGVLVALNELFDTHLTTEQLCEIGLTVGADVPFCLVGGTAYVTGIGENIQPLPPLPDCHIVIAQPDQGISTKEAYAAVDNAEILARPDNAAAIAALKAGDLNGVCQQAVNVFEAATNLPGVADIRRRMEQFHPLCSQMTGSGSVVFAIFEDERVAEACLEELGDYYYAVLVQPCRGANAYISSF
ncbi:MAG: 4-(cytidine 5'-diphospho)-2-C-methyl-D-erythritol kinase [Ruminococcaceae bacterium]|nr:4-(cytidine 5'-diphospho)-2-C-methyl-D-erythritol kinase [Oscillospiraceae bacterium]